MRWRLRKCPRTVRVDPMVEEAHQAVELIDEMRSALKATAPQREASRIAAREVRQKVEALVERNHFGESIEQAMQRRGA